MVAKNLDQSLLPWKNHEDTPNWVELMTHQHLTIDGMLSGTGVRDTNVGGYIDPKELGLTVDLVEKITAWVEKYEDAHYAQFEDSQQNELLDAEGIEIRNQVKTQFPRAKVSYFSSAKMEKIIWE